MNKPANPTCAGCRHECVRGLAFLPFIKGQFCGHPLALDCVTGQAVTDCADMRKARARRGDPVAFCGLQGRNWEPKAVRALDSLLPEDALDVLRGDAPPLGRDDNNPVPRVMSLISPHRHFQA